MSLSLHFSDDYFRWNPCTSQAEFESWMADVRKYLNWAEANSTFNRKILRELQDRLSRIELNSADPKQSRQQLIFDLIHFHYQLGKLNSILSMKFDPKLVQCAISGHGSAKSNAKPAETKESVREFYKREFCDFPTSESFYAAVNDRFGVKRSTVISWIKEWLQGTT